MEFTDFYKLPLKTYDSGIVWTADDKRAFDFPLKEMDNDGFYLSDEEMQTIVSIINGENKVFGSELKLSYNDSYILNEEDGVPKMFISIRGWGALTGGLHLDNITAIKIQDDFAEFIINKLKQEK